MARVIEVILGLLDEFIVATLIVVSILIIMYYAGLINLTILIIGILIYISIVTLIGYRVIKVQIEKPYSSIEPSVIHILQTSNTTKGSVVKTFLNWICKSYAKLQFHYSRLGNNT